VAPHRGTDARSLRARAGADPLTRLTIGITTRNRPDALARLLDSLQRLREFDPEVLIFDDDSDPPAVAVAPGLHVRIMRDSPARGYIVGRNRMVRDARAPFVLLLDDDAVIFDSEPIRRALAVLERDPSLAAVAFAQAEPDGRPWPVGMQPGRATVPSLVPTYIGFAHLVRRDVFLAHGGYCEMLDFYGEEKELCIRLMDAGHAVVYLPDALVGHLPAPGGRVATRYVRHVIRNDCLVSMISEPLPMAVVSMPIRLWRFTRMAKNIPGGDPGGLAWVVRELVRLAPAAWRLRRAVAWRTIRRWRHLARNTVPYIAP
jgi:glycosyltransferase involved in cell wall biosynthesis